VGPLGHSLAALGALAAAPPALALLAAKPAWRRGLGERLGARARGSRERPGAQRQRGRGGRCAPALAAHGVRSRPDLDAGGQDLLRGARPAILRAAPLDHPWRGRGLPPRARVTPRAGGDRAWPSWIFSRAPSASLHDRVGASRPEYAALPRLRWSRVLGALEAIGARSERDAERFVALGAPEGRIEVTGDLKLDPPARPAAAAPALVAVLGRVPLVVGGSTHEGEEEALLGALDAARAAGLRAALALAPRHPERFEGVARAIAASGRPCRRRSRLEPRALEDGEVLLLDGLG
jgi:hypothetical protein